MNRKTKTTKVINNNQNQNEKLKEVENLLVKVED